MKKVLTLALLFLVAAPLFSQPRQPRQPRHPRYADKPAVVEDDSLGMAKSFLNKLIAEKARLAELQAADVDSVSTTIPGRLAPVKMKADGSLKKAYEDVIKVCERNIKAYSDSVKAYLKCIK